MNKMFRRIVNQFQQLRDSGGKTGGVDARTVRYASGFLAREARLSLSTSEVSERKQTPSDQPASPSCSKCAGMRFQAQAPPTSPDSLFNIPRKPVGGQKVLSMPTSKENRSGAQVFSHLKRLSGSGKKVKRAPSSATLDIEDTTLGLHAHSSTSAKRQNSKHDQACSRPMPQLSSNKAEYAVDSKYRNVYSLNDYLAIIEPLPGTKLPNLGKAYRRPTKLLPAHLRGPVAPAHGAFLQSAYIGTNAPHRNYHTPPNTIPRPRPLIRRLEASTAIHRLEASQGLATSESRDKQSLPFPLREREASGYHGTLKSVKPSIDGAPT
ncbi:MAG: hypothetical protein Q9213_006443 [Squamulea squamosa]